MTKGRHDPCLLPRFVPMGEAMMALVLVDHWLRHKTTRVELIGIQLWSPVARSGEGVRRVGSQRRDHNPSSSGSPSPLRGGRLGGGVERRARPKTSPRRPTLVRSGRRGSTTRTESCVSPDPSHPAPSRTRAGGEHRNDEGRANGSPLVVPADHFLLTSPAPPEPTGLFPVPCPRRESAAAGWRCRSTSTC